MLIALLEIAIIQVMVHLINGRSSNSKYHHFKPPQPAPTITITIIILVTLTTITLPALQIPF